MKKKIIKTKEKNAGEILLEKTANKVPDRATPEELTQEMLVKEWEDMMSEWIREGKKVFKRDFFVILNLKLEQSLNYAPHLIPEVRQTCPDPFYDQSIWKFHRDEDRLEFLWSIPDIATVRLFRDDPLNCPSDQVQLRQFVLDYLDGTLQKKADEFNKEFIRSENGRSRN